MAIKGKRRTRGGGRAVATAPRPRLVSPRTPLLRRTGVRITLALILVAAVVTAVVAGITVRNDNRVRADARRQVSEFQTRVEAAMTSKGVGQRDVSGFLILPNLSQTLSQLQAGQLRPKDVEKARKDTGTWAENTTQAATTISALDAGTNELTTAELTDARTLMQQALQMVSGVARSAGVALGLEGERQTQLVGTLSEQSAAAAGVFNSGWRRIEALRSELGLPLSAPPAGGGVPGLPGGGVPPGVPGGGVPPGVPEGGIPGLPEGGVPSP